MDDRPSPPAERRFPRSVYGHGSEPDPRFSLANERTFLAWIRTSLALVAGGVALEALAAGIHPAFRLAAAVLLVVTGAVVAAVAWFSWSRVERSIRLSRPLPAPSLGLPLALAVLVTAVLVGAGMAVA
ncbi:DUF202 domain-containing protein [Pseudonocardia sp. C8]|uniref:YidH family protein n=1 Tax=Pseudonocardia sp. C8 TaxID=2762759 RepID=UPI0016436851|nr:DUF202 domain-containing protein [Pseudonocardia sp. C8]MBC3192478.1 DUF202 domain-containing protein [Pseudonocardia sp. C8]